MYALLSGRFKVFTNSAVLVVTPKSIGEEKTRFGLKSTLSGCGEVTKGSIGTGCSALLPGINRRPNLCPSGTGPTRLRQEGWLQSRRGLEGNRLRGKAGARRTQEGPGFAGRKVDVILVTELTRWGRSARFAVRSLTSFKFRFVSSPHSGQRCVSNAVKRHGSLYAIL
jgi:hypothetical protein